MDLTEVHARLHADRGIGNLISLAGNDADFYSKLRHMGALMVYPRIPTDPPNQPGMDQTAAFHGRCLLDIHWVFNTLLPIFEHRGDGNMMHLANRQETRSLPFLVLPLFGILQQAHHSLLCLPSLSPVGHSFATRRDLRFLVNIEEEDLVMVFMVLKNVQALFMIPGVCSL